MQNHGKSFSRQLTSIQHVTAVWFLLFTLSRIVGVEFLDSVVLSMIATLNFCAGVAIARRLGLSEPSRSEGNRPYAIGIGMAIGTVLPALLGVALQFMNISILNPHLVFPIGTFLLELLLRVRRQGVDASSNLRQTSSISGNDANQLCAIFIGTLVVLAGWSWRLFFPIVCVGIVWWVLSKFGVRNAFRTIFALGFVAQIITFLVQHLYGRIISSDWIGLDVLWDEAQGTAVARSLFSDPLFAGKEHHIYFLANYWSGTLADFAHTQPLVVSGQFGIVTGVLIVISVVFAATSEIWGSTAASFSSIFLLGAQGAFPDDVVLTEALRVPNLLPLAWLLAAILITWRFHNSFSKEKLILVALLISGVVAGKLPYVATFILFLGVLITLNFRSTSTGSNRKLLALLTFSLVSVLLTFEWMGESSGTSSIGFTLTNLPWIVGLFLFRGLGLQSVLGKAQTTYVRVLLLGGVLVGSLVVSNHGYHLVISSVLALNAVLVAKPFTDSLYSLPRRTFLYFSLCVGGSMSLSYWITHIHSIRTNGLVHHLLFGRELAWWFITIFALLIVGRMLFRNWKGSLAIIASMGCGLYIGHAFQQPIEKVVYGVGSDYSILYDKDRLEVGEFLRENTEESAVIASNSVCDKRVGNGEETPTGDVGCQANLDAWLSALSRRQTFFEAPYWSSAGLILNEEEADRYGLVIRFGQAKALEDARRLADLGVDYFVANEGDLSNIGCRSLNANVEFGRYRIYNLMRLKEVLACTTEDQN